MQFGKNQTVDSASFSGRISALEMAAYILSACKGYFIAQDRAGDQVTLPQLQKVMLITSFLHDYLWGMPLVREMPMIARSGHLRRVYFESVYGRYIKFGNHHIDEAEIEDLTFEFMSGLPEDVVDFIRASATAFSTCPCHAMSFIGRKYIHKIERDAKSHHDAVAEVIEDLLHAFDIDPSALRQLPQEVFPVLAERINNASPEPDLESEVELIAYERDGALINAVSQEDFAPSRPSTSMSDVFARLERINANPGLKRYFEQVEYPRSDALAEKLPAIEDMIKPVR